MKVKGNTIRGGTGPRRGAVLIYALVIAVTIAGMCLALLRVNLGTERSRVATRTSQRSFYAAEAGLSDAYVQLTTKQIAVDLDAPAFVGTQDFPVELGKSAYWVEVSQVDSRNYSLASTGIDGLDRKRLELILGKESNGFFQYAAFGADGVVLDSNAFIDSYDSILGDYDSQIQDGEEYALENGHVGSNADILLKANTEIHGDAKPGPDGVVDDTAPNVYVSGSTEPGDEPVVFPPIDYPVSSSPPGSLSGKQVVTVGPGLVHYSSVLLDGGSKLTIQGPAQLVVDDFEMKSNTELIFDTTGGPIELFAPNDFVLQSNSGVTTLSDSALDVTLFLGGNNTTKHPPDRVELGANAQFVGAIYAPEAEFSLASNFEIYGSIMCGFLDLSSFGEIHFDEALLYDGWGATGELDTVYWHALPLAEAAP